ncbi:hypothetical protein CLOP_g6616 [Closterium sp. NIES-67]|nr:hypothetical protein CLOP_g6616 [Closterium sp. NIES-67]
MPYRESSAQPAPTSPAPPADAVTKHPNEPIRNAISCFRNGYPTVILAVSSSSRVSNINDSRRTRMVSCQTLRTPRTRSRIFSTG